MASPAISPYVTKIVKHRYAGEDMVFRLSHALFSSFDIDAGSRLLLKTVAQKIDMGAIETVLDEGCGVGVLGQSLSKKNPNIDCLLRDRDSLAIRFAMENACLNKLAKLSFAQALLLEGLDDRRFDLIISNLPAKAGGPVLSDFFARAREHLTPKGVLAIVIVMPLAEFAKGELEKNGYRVEYVEEDRQYRVYHARPEVSSAFRLESLPWPYFRQEAHAILSDVEFDLQTAYGLPDFDTPGYCAQVAARVLSSVTGMKRVFAWNPGQGYIAGFIEAKEARPDIEFVLSGRDLLQLRATEVNLAGKAASVELKSYPGIDKIEADVSNGCDLGIFFLEELPEIEWPQFTAKFLDGFLDSGRRALVAGTSTYIFRLTQLLPKAWLTSSEKYRGFRAVLLSR